MHIFSILIVYILGLLVVNSISTKFNLFIKIGIAFPIAMGLISLVSFFSSFFAVPISRFSFFVQTVCLLVLFLWIIKKKLGFRNLLELPINHYKALKNELPKTQIAWFVLAAIVVYVLYGISCKSMFWPCLHYDSITGYDFYAKTIAEEGVLNSSLFNPENKISSVRTLYPPMFPLSFAYALVWGFATAKIINVLLFISLILCFYGYAIKVINPLGAILFTLILLITPEMLAQSALAMINVPHACYIFTSIGGFYLWYKEKNSSFLLLASVMGALATWGRSEGLLFVGIFGLFYFIHVINRFRKQKQIQRVLIQNMLLIGLPTLLCFVIWELYLKYMGWDAGKQPISLEYVYNSERWKQIYEILMVKLTFEKGYFGYTTHLFFFVAPLSILYQLITWKFSKTSNLFLLYIAVIWLLFLFLFYQFRLEIPSHIPGYKRGLFNFFPLLFLFICQTPLIQKLFALLTIEKKEPEHTEFKI